MNFIPTILSGGVGSRLWPISRADLPKQFIELPEGSSLFQKTYNRAISLPYINDVLVVTNADLFSKSQDELIKFIHQPKFILEPCSKNTAAAVACASIYASEKYGNDTILLILPADHLIEDQLSFAKYVDNAVHYAGQNKIVTFGIKPSYAETGYGYIQVEDNKVLKFIEKPSKKKATEYFESGNFLWNSGMICFNVATMISEMDKHSPNLLDDIRRCLDGAINAQPVTLKKFFYDKAINQSIDNAILEKSDKLIVIPCEMGWSDIGSWISYSQLTPSDSNGNNVSGNVLVSEVNDCVLHSTGRVIAALGVEDLIIVENSDALLVAHKSRAQDVKQIYQQLKEINHPSFKSHKKVNRAWGSFEVIDQGVGFKVKRILVNIGQKLSLQRHQHRSEHWVVVSGSAKVINDGLTLELSQNQSTFIEVGHWHQLINSGDGLLEVVEVQTGQYLEEDDIERCLDD